MLGIALAVLAFVLTAAASWRSLAIGLRALLAIGYAYGIVRANVSGLGSYLTFDAAVVGLYAGRWLGPPSAGAQVESNNLRLWVMALCAWPIALMIVPSQDPLIQLLGLRVAVYMLPFIIFGARLSSDDWRGLALWLAVLNAGALVLALGEFALGLGPFFPKNPTTVLIYQQSDVGSLRAPRIPSSFATAHVYGATMVYSLPIVLGAFLQRRPHGWRGLILPVGVVAGTLGVFMSATRINALYLAIILLIALLSSRIRVRTRIASVFLLVCVAALVTSEQRFQRFTSLQDKNYTEGRVGVSVNRGIVDLVAEYPFGNGLGGGGTNIPYFLADRVRNPLWAENEYARISLEQGFIGLALWATFLVWLLVRARRDVKDDWFVGRRTAWWIIAGTFGSAWIGTGVLAAIPQAPILFLLMGWIAGGVQGRDGRAVLVSQRFGNRHELTTADVGGLATPGVLRAGGSAHAAVAQLGVREN